MKKKAVKKRSTEIDIDYLMRCKYSSPESKFEWLQSALEFAQTPKKITKVKKWQAKAPIEKQGRNEVS